MKIRAGNGGQKQASRVMLLIGFDGRFPEVLRTLLNDQFEGLEVDEADDISTVLEKSKQSSVALVLLHESRCDEMLLFAATAKEHFAQSLVALSFTGPVLSADCIRLCLKSSLINSFLPIDMNVEVWLSAVGLMLKGGRYIPPRMIDELFEDGVPEREHLASATAQGEALSKLTPREMEVLELASRGLQNKNIADELGLSEHTVKLHMHHVIAKLEAHNRTEASACYLVHMASKRAGTSDG